MKKFYVLIRSRPFLILREIRFLQRILMATGRRSSPSQPFFTFPQAPTKVVSNCSRKFRVYHVQLLHQDGSEE